MKKALRLLGLAALAATAPAFGAVFTYNFGSEGVTIPDNSPAGVTDTQTVSLTGVIYEIAVRLNIAGGSNGDYYAWLVHDDRISILLNRPGRSAEMPDGYNDPGLNVTFSNSASNGDIHVYRGTLFGNETTPLGEPLNSSETGLWAPDGRNTSPLTVTTSSPRTATLAAFNGQEASGEWTLFVADVNGNNVGTLMSWGMEITLVPEPAEVALSSAALLVAWAGWRKRAKARA
jgi:subtilisin-like proprotein convertase family protein